MAEKEVKITYETLFEISRRERTREELQKLDKGFYDEVREYIKGKLRHMAEQESKLDMFSSQEKEKTRMQLENIRKILKELYERREKKILNMALNKSRTNSNLVDTSALLDEEKGFYQELVSLFNKYRKEIFMRTVNTSLEQVKEEKQDEVGPDKKETGMKKVKILTAIPKFIGPELKAYGPFEQGQEVELPEQVARVFIEKGKAQKCE